MRFLITGAAGFIGFHLARALLDGGHDVLGFDGFTPYYDVGLKRSRHALLAAHPRYRGHEARLEDADAVRAAFDAAAADVVVHLAAQAGVRYSVENPGAYVQSNLIGTFNVLEAARSARSAHLMIASTSSVYGAGEALPFREDGDSSSPITFYAATKKATEAMAHSYAHLFDMPTTAFRFFSVYGPWGRPDMAFFRFTENILRGRPIEVYDHGRSLRDFTYVADLVEAVIRLSRLPPGRGQAGEGAASGTSAVAPFRVVNIGLGQPMRLLDFITAIEAATGKTAIRNMLPAQPGDVPATWADTSLLKRLTGYVPSTPVEEGIAAFVDWYRGHYGA